MPYTGIAACEKYENLSFSMYLVGRGSSVGVTARYGLADPGFESREGGRDIMHPTRPITHPPFCAGVPGLFLASGAPDPWRSPPTPM
jgi:hypothetical protein